MPIIKDIQLLVPEDRDTNRIFFHQTRSISFLYSRLLPNLKIKEDKGILINCVSNLSKIDSMDSDLYTMFNYFSVFVKVDVNKFLCLSSDLQKKQSALDIIQEGMEKAVDVFDWDKDIFREIYKKIQNLNFQNTYTLMKKSSPNRYYVCNIICDHGVFQIDVYMEIKKKNGSIINPEKIFSVSDTYEQYLFEDWGILSWKQNHKVEFADKDHKEIFQLTFLEKEIKENLLWKLVKR
ncbi:MULTISPECIES: hypothetical protein [Bacillus]|uniref:Uncharacterized protein n=2 Tax=Bacillus TaxID=1386 RepID=A0A0M4FNK7_9BACI|nr:MULTISPECIES: hypothetical protein [Bacillus]ALC80197.1 hypothetical protein AM592_00225 [Bacillus gobiensis]MBP1082820.1 hypothetical protein [Bacillus capparidis]MED1098463.1 hypothetical protein [Bacillus capparidis]